MYKITYFRGMHNVLSTVACLSASIVVSEFLGYLIHRLLHSGRIQCLSRAHMRHHLVLYGPLQSQRPGTEYRDATTGAASLGNIGLEWLIPSAILLAIVAGVLHYLQVRRFQQLVTIGGSLAWSFLMFSYVHDRMHVAGSWMERNRCLKKWFMDARDSHDTHHWTLNDEGFMDKNFGIAFFFFDRLFGTMAKERPAFNQRGYLRALMRFHDLLIKPEA
jgi:sterol desaturase/sphingolipid hydroxylase (fatty acid hydroxylase superfamily)